MVTDIDSTLAGLAEPTRRQIIDLLRDRPLRAGEIADALGMSGPATSRHLRVLRRKGVIQGTDIDDDARVRVYHLRPEAFAVLRQWLDHVEAYWSDQLIAFRDHAEVSRNARPTSHDYSSSEATGNDHHD